MRFICDRLPSENSAKRLWHPGLAVALAVCYLSGMGLCGLIPINESLAVRLVYITGFGLSFASVLLRLFEMRSGGVKVGWIIPVSLFWCTYAARYLNDVVFDNSLLQREPQYYTLMIWGVSFVALLGGLSIPVSAWRNASLIWVCVGFSLAATGPHLTAVSEGSERLRTIVTGPIMLGHIGASAALMGAALLLLNPNKSRLWLRLIVGSYSLFIGVMTMLTAGSRSPVVASLIGLSLIFMVRVFAKGGRVAMGGAMFVLGILLILAAPDSSDSFVFQRLKLSRENYLTLENSSNRDYLIQNSLNQFLDSPVVGSALEERETGFIYPHNIVVEALMATGVVGGIPFLISWTIGVWGIILLFVSDRRLIWIAVLHAQMVVLSMFSISIPEAWGYWFTLGGVLGVIAQRRSPVDCERAGPLALRNPTPANLAGC